MFSLTHFSGDSLLILWTPNSISRLTLEDLKTKFDLMSSRVSPNLKGWERRDDTLSSRGTVSPFGLLRLRKNDSFRFDRHHYHSDNLSLLWVSDNVFPFSQLSRHDHHLLKFFNLLTFRLALHQTLVVLSYKSKNTKLTCSSIWGSPLVKSV
jgi:hypothetical protein